MIVRRLREYLSCVYIPLLEEDLLIDENCVVFKGLRVQDPIGDVLHIGDILFKVSREKFEVKRVVFLEEIAEEVVMVVEFTENIMTQLMLQKAHLVLPTVKTESYDGLISVTT